MKRRGTARHSLGGALLAGDSARAARGEGKGCSARWEDEEE